MNIKVDNKEYLFHFDFKPEEKDIIEYANGCANNEKDNLEYFINMHKIIWALYKGCLPNFGNKWDTKSVHENGTSVSISAVWRNNLAYKE
jgi:hypothetical protein